MTETAKWLLCLALLTFPLWGVDAPTPAQISACRDDALRFCAPYLGSQSTARACMLAHREKLSQACREAFK